MTYDIVVANGTVVDPTSGTLAADVGIDNEEISAIGRPGSLDGERTIDAAGKHVLPGVIDPHTHHGIYRPFGDDARTESRSGVVGGVTTTGNFFKSRDPYLEVLEEFIDEAEANYHHDYYFALSPISWTHIEEIPALVEKYGIRNYKLLAHYRWTIAEEGHPALDGLDQYMLDDYADSLIETLANQPGETTLGYHSENVDLTNAATERAKAARSTGYEALVEAFPGHAEAQSMAAGASLARQHDYDDSFYAVHISSGRTANEIAALSGADYQVSGETCPHYLTLTAEEADDRAKINPPIRSEWDRETLWERIADGTIDHVGTDHCCNMLDEKVGADIWETLLAFPSSALLLPLVLSEGVSEGRISLERAVEITSTNNARAWNLYPKKGAISVGSDADLTVVDLEATKTVTAELLQSAADYTPYEGMAVRGWPTHTLVRGSVVFEDGVVVGDPGHGTRADASV